jgi:hypothetical protein
VAFNVSQISGSAAGAAAAVVVASGLHRFEKIAARDFFVCHMLLPEWLALLPAL